MRGGAFATIVTSGAAVRREILSRTSKFGLYFTAFWGKMSTRTEREKNKKQHDRHNSILMDLLREDQNKYCADCGAKGLLQRVNISVKIST